MNNKKHIFFDLDKTIWDFDFNAKVVLQELFHQSPIYQSKSIQFSDFQAVYSEINHKLWQDLRNGKIDKAYLRSNRFHLTNLYFNIDDKMLAKQLDEEYLEKTPAQKQLISYAKPVLYLLKRRYQLHILTNGFEDVQHFKLHNCGLSELFNTVVTSDRAEACKPQKQIFEFALKHAQAKSSESVMIGDDFEVDILGADQVGIAPIFFNREKQEKIQHSYSEINCLSGLLELL